MADDTIQAIARGEPTALAGGRAVDVGTRTIRVEESLKGMELDCVRECEFGTSVAVVCDPTTYQVLGQRIEAALRRGIDCALVELGPSPHCDLETVAGVEEQARKVDALIAVGSGTVNDIAKLAAARADRPYAVFATAPSMNGYVSANAAVYVNGLKSTLPARAPVAAFFDLAVLCAAPERMIRAGLGDSLCRTTAQVDWLMSHMLRDSAYDDLPYRLLARDEDDLVAQAGSLTRGDLVAMRHLVDTLILAGFGMTAVQSSAPGSQGEHLISHYADMLTGPSANGSLHGEQIAVTTMTMSLLQHAILSGPAPELTASSPDRGELLARFGPDLGAACWKEFEPKRTTCASADAVNRRLAERWPELQSRLAAVMRPPGEIQSALERAGAPCRHAEIGWTRAFYVNTVRHAREVRNRYTFLDLAYEAGMLGAAIERYV